MSFTPEEILVGIVSNGLYSLLLLGSAYLVKKWIDKRRLKAESIEKINSRVSRYTEIATQQHGKNNHGKRIEIFLLLVRQISELEERENRLSRKVDNFMIFFLFSSVSGIINNSNFLYAGLPMALILSGLIYDYSMSPDAKARRKRLDLLENSLGTIIFNITEDLLAQDPSDITNEKIKAQEASLNDLKALLARSEALLQRQEAFASTLPAKTPVDPI